MHLTVDHRKARAGYIVRLLLAGLLAFLLPLAAQAVPAADDIVIVGFKGEVKITSAGAALEPRAGAVIGLPAAIHTGPGGSVDLRQGDTTIGVGPATQLDFPVQAAAGPIDRVSQPAGNAYYSVGPRGNRKMRVETPYLVAVIKGTQFNVAVTPKSSTISLHEGRLEILATQDGIEPVLLNAGEVAIRRKDENLIRVLKVGSGASQSSDTGGGNNETGTAFLPTGNGGNGPDIPGAAPPMAGEDDDGFGPGNPGSPTTPPDVGVTIGTDGGIGVGGDLGVGQIDAAVELGAGGIDAGVNAGVALGNVGVDIGADAGVDLGGGGVEAGIGATVDASVGGVDASVDVSADAGIDLGTGTVQAGAETGIDLGGAGIDAAADASVDLGGGSVAADVDAGVDAGAASADASIDAGANIGAGTVDAGADVGVAGVDAGVDVGVDLTGQDAGVDLGVNVLGTEIDVGLGGAGGEPPAADAPAAGSTGLLGGILGHLGRH